MKNLEAIKREVALESTLTANQYDKIIAWLDECYTYGWAKGNYDGRSEGGILEDDYNPDGDE